jgi:hypothetical protein
VEIYFYAFLTSPLAEGEWSFSPVERTSDTLWIGGWVDLRVGLDAVVRRTKITTPARNSTPVFQPVA